MGDPGCSAWYDNDEYNVPCCGGPPPPPPPPPPACQDGQDNDGDGLYDYPSDPGCSGYTDNDEYNAPPPPEPPPPLPDIRAGSYTDMGMDEYFYFDYRGLVRCKTQKFKQNWSEAGLYDVLIYEGGYQVCYRYNGGIVSVKTRWGDATKQVYPWQWKGNASGYPNHVRYDHKVEFYYRGQLDFCALKWGCLYTTWPWVTFTFYDTNVQTRVAGVVK